MDLHADQIEFFNIPVWTNIYASLVLTLGDIWRSEHKDLLVVSPDVGGVVDARAHAKHLDADLAIIDKRRRGRTRARSCTSSASRRAAPAC